MTDPGKREKRLEAFKQDALKSWEDYQATGQHATADEVAHWLASWGSEDEATARPCHR